MRLPNTLIIMTGKMWMLQRAGHVASVAKTENVYKILTEKSLRKHPI